MTFKSDKTKAIAAITFAYALLAIVTLLVKYLSKIEDYSTAEIAFFRNFFGLFPLYFILKKRKLTKDIFKTTKLKLHLLRAITGTIAMFCLFYAMGNLPLADAVALTFLGPIFVALIAIPVLGEKVGWHRWAAMGVAFIGMILMVGPTGNVSLLGTLAGLGFSFFLGFAMTSVKLLTRTENDLTIIIYFTIISTILTALALPFYWKMPETPIIWASFIATGLLGTIVQIFVTMAYRLGDASLVTPFNYTSLLWGAFYGYIFFAEIPSLQLLSGAALVIIAGLIILWRERSEIRSQKSEVRS